MSNEKNPQAGQGRPMPKKEQDLFKSVVRYYETKQYKKGIKSADLILKKFPKHGETLCMRGLILNCTGKKDEAIDLVKLGLMNDMRSHVCWHVYGLLHRAGRDYNEAIKAYKQALRIDPENLQILRDLSLLQIQMRDISGFVLTRHTILNLKPSQKINWLSFALATHLADDFRGAVSVIDTYLGTLEKDSPELLKGFESSELVLYRNSLLAEIPNNWKEVLHHLNDCKNIVVDEIAWLKAKGKCHLMLNLFVDAKQTYMTLLQRGSTEDYNVHSGYMCALLQLDNETSVKALNLKGSNTIATMQPLLSAQKQILLCEYQHKLKHQFPMSHAIQRIPLTLLEGEQLKNSIDLYCRQSLTRGVPSLASDLSSLFLIENDDGRYYRAIDPLDIRSHTIFISIVHLVEGYMTSLTTNSKFPIAQLDNSKKFIDVQAPSTLLWTIYLRSCLYELGGDLCNALKQAESCLKHTPTVVDLYELKGRLLKACGDINAAANCLDEGRKLDKQDRYINNQTTKYMLQADREEEALDMIALFTRDESEPEQNLIDMQCTWYELELAACFARKQQLGKSLKTYMAVIKHFEDFHEDQFDFHSYCIRKVTLRSYVEVLRWEDELWCQSFYRDAVGKIINCYLSIYDNPLKNVEDDKPDYSSMSPAERKKAKAVARKKKKVAEKKLADAEQKRNEKLKNTSKQQKGAATPIVKIDDDPNGDKLREKDAIEEAKKYSAILVKNSSNHFSTWIIQYDVSIRRNKMIMSLQALCKAKAIDPGNYALFTRIIDFSQKNEAMCEHTSLAVQRTVMSGISTLLGGNLLSEFISNAADISRTDLRISLQYKIAIAKALIEFKIGHVDDAFSIITAGGLQGRGVSIASCTEAFNFFKNAGDEGTVIANKWILSAREYFPLLKLEIC